MTGATGSPPARCRPRAACILAVCLSVLVAACRWGTAEPKPPGGAPTAETSANPGRDPSPTTPDAPAPSATPEIERTATPRCELDAGEGHILSVHSDLYVRDGLPRSIATIAATSADVWVGFGDQSLEGGGGVWRYDGGGWITYTQGAGFPASDNVQLLRVAPDGRVWAGAGLQVARFAGGVWQQMADRNVLKGPVLDIAFTPGGATWIASALELSRFDGQTWHRHGKLAHDLAVGPGGPLWVSGWEGSRGSNCVARFDDPDWMIYPTLDRLGHGVGKLAVTPDGALWGTSGEQGVVKYDGETWTRFSGAGGLPAEVRELAVAPDGVLWASGRGLAYFDGHRWVLHSATLCVNALTFAPDGTLWLGVADNLVHFEPF